VVNFVRTIVEHLPSFQRFLSSLKDGGYIMEGYARKYGEAGSRLLAQMVDLLRKRSLVDKVFVSPIRKANE
ncbi:hypothetical protein K492DRAFT_134914, partial [Lichtheimia hyalospora FSU 10163]